MMVTGKSEPSGRPKLLIRVVFGGLSRMLARFKMSHLTDLHWTWQE